jgi:hypothetical protein
MSGAPLSAVLYTPHDKRSPKSCHIRHGAVEGLSAAICENTKLRDRVRDIRGWSVRMQSQSVQQISKHPNGISNYIQASQWE